MVVFFGNSYLLRGPSCQRALIRAPLPSFDGVTFREGLPSLEKECKPTGPKFIPKAEGIKCMPKFPKYEKAPKEGTPCLSGCLAVWLSGCLAVWLSGCLAVWCGLLSGCLACLAVWPSGLSGLSGCLVRLAVWCGRLSGAAGCLERPGVCLSPCLLCVFWFKCFTDVFCFVGLQSYPKTQGSSKQTGGPRL